MSNPTPETNKVIESTVIDPTPIDVPKTPGKVKTALRHPFQTIKRHNVVSTALVTFIVGVVSTLLFLKKDKNEEGEVTEVAPDDNIVDFPVATD